MNTFVFLVDFQSKWYLSWIFLPLVFIIPHSLSLYPCCHSCPVSFVRFFSIQTWSIVFLKVSGFGLSLPLVISYGGERYIITSDSCIIHDYTLNIPKLIIFLRYRLLESDAYSISTFECFKNTSSLTGGIGFRYFSLAEIKGWMISLPVCLTWKYLNIITKIFGELIK